MTYREWEAETLAKATETKGMTYSAWKKMVDEACWRLVGLSIDDLPDCLLADWFDAGTRPVTAARRAIRMAQGEGR